MTRKEEREKAAKIRADQYSHMVQWNECYHHFKQGAEWADKTMLEKACEWLRTNADSYCNGTDIAVNAMVEDFKQAMEE